MLTDVLQLLACPVCTGPLASAPGSVTCPAGHSFDIAKGGYLSLLSGTARTTTADTAAMVAARERFLARGHYLPVAQAVSAAIDAGPVADIGGGTGWLLARVLDAAPGAACGVVVDVSKYAARRAARVHPAVGAVVADAWSRLPLADASFGAVVSFFAPRNAPEFARILRRDGVAIIVTPTPAHLASVRKLAGLIDVEPGKDARLATAFADDFTTISSDIVREELHLTHDEVRDLIAMGPSAHHTSSEAVERALADAAPLLTTLLEVKVTVFRQRA